MPTIWPASYRMSSTRCAEPTLILRSWSHRQSDHSRWTTCTTRRIFYEHSSLFRQSSKVLRSGCVNISITRRKNRLNSQHSNGPKESSIILRMSKRLVSLMSRYSSIWVRKRRSRHSWKSKKIPPSLPQRITAPSAWCSLQSGSNLMAKITLTS